ncbi:MAG: class I SAM-dependent rRNA methyltransferase [Paracoccaceae bacterium]|jgi:23S rRNA (cytosine1962-C5)-methyltransferase|nr:class I SAM-dependent rRNA methyltransferase [Paracoccaceae bacterium]
MSNVSLYQTVKLKKTKTNLRRKGFPWYYLDEIVFDRRTKNIKAGEIVKIQDSNLGKLGVFAFNPNSKIAARLLDVNHEAVIDNNWIRKQLKLALDLRKNLFKESFYRLVHGEVDNLPGVIIDRFGDTVVLQPNSAWADLNKEKITESIMEFGISNIVLNCMSRSRRLEGLNEGLTVIQGAVTEPIKVKMNKAVYFADVLHGQKTGIFFDQRFNHELAAKLSKGKDVLDVFSHVGGFGLAALVSGARKVFAVDSSAPALSLAVKGAEESGVSEKFETINSDAFDAMKEFFQSNRYFDMVVCDPPAFSPSKKTLNTGLRAYERVALHSSRLVKPNGYLVLCSCSHAVDLSKFRNACVRGITRAGRQVQIISWGGAGPDHPINSQLEQFGYLKSIFFRLLS